MRTSFLFEAGQIGEARICEAHHFEVAQARFVAGQAICAHALFGIDDFADTRKEPWVKHRDAVDFIVRKPVTHRLRDSAHAVWGLLGDRFDNCGFLWRAFDLDLVETREVALHRGERLLQALVDCTTDRHSFADGFHRCG